MLVCVTTLYIYTLVMSEEAAQSGMRQAVCNEPVVPDCEVTICCLIQALPDRLHKAKLNSPGQLFVESLVDVVKACNKGQDQLGSIP